jgi:hypothetical protein
MMNTPETFKDFYVKEIGNTIKDRFAPDLNLGFFFQNGSQAFHSRALFSEIFHYDNLRAM